jgi:hypothetical protein
MTDGVNSGKKEKKDETNVLLKNFSFVCIYTSMAETLRQIQTWAVFTTLYALPNLQIDQISSSVCPWQAFTT